MGSLVQVHDSGKQMCVHDRVQRGTRDVVEKKDQREGAFSDVSWRSFGVANRQSGTQETGPLCLESTGYHSGRSKATDAVTPKP